MDRGFGRRMSYDPATYWPERYERQGDAYVAKGGRADLHDAQREALTPYLRHLPTDGRVLDFGCGPGRFRGALEAQCLEYEGVDLVPGLGTMEAEDIKPGSFDCAVALFVLQHIVDPETYVEALRMLRAALKPGGDLLVVDHDPEPDMDEHMCPRGPAGVLERGGFFAYWSLGEYDGHWIGLFIR